MEGDDDKLRLARLDGAGWVLFGEAVSERD